MRQLVSRILFVSVLSVLVSISCSQQQPSEEQVPKRETNNDPPKLFRGGLDASYFKPPPRNQRDERKLTRARELGQLVRDPEKLHAAVKSARDKLKRGAGSDRAPWRDKIRDKAPLQKKDEL